MGLKKAVIVLLTLFLILPVFATALAEGFEDVKEHWAEEEINAWKEKGLIDGYEDGSFKPDQSTTRAEFMALVNRSIGYTETGTISFSDVDEGDWYYSEIAVAVGHGYISGYLDGTVRPKQSITREEAAAIVVRLSGEPVSGTPDFMDNENIAPWSSAAVATAARLELMGGYPNGKFKPCAPITRAETVATLQRLLNHMDADPDVGMVSSIDLVGPTIISIPPSTTDAIEESFTALVMDEDGFPMNDEEVTWSLSASVSGVEVDAETGVVTVQDEDTTNEGTFTLVATSITNNEVTSEITVTLKNIVVGKLSTDFYAAGDTLEFTVGGLRANDEVIVFMPIFTGSAGWPWASDLEVISGTTVIQDGDSTSRAWIGMTDADGNMTVSGEVQPDLPNGVVHITLPGYGYSIDNAIELQDDEGAGVRVGE